MKILMTGATGLIGCRVGRKLVEEGHEIRILSRNEKKAKQSVPFPCEVIEWDLLQKPLGQKEFKDVDVVIHLLGETVNGRWNKSKKEAILNSRKISSQNLLKNMPAKVKTVISASAVGFYGDRGDEVLDESSEAGQSFLAEVCQVWESEVKKLSGNQRTLIIRIGVVLSRQGGALKKLIPLFQKNLGAVLGSGQQWMSWISLNDLCRLICEAVKNEQYQGVVNGVQPTPVTNQQFTEVLGQSLNVMTLPSVPRLALKTLLGEMSEIVLASQKVLSPALKKLGFSFEDKELAVFLKKELEPYENGQGFFSAEQFIEAPIKNVFNFFSAAENLEKITPPLLSFKVENMSTPQIEKGTLIDYKLKIHGVPASWQTLIDEWQPPFRFVDMQLKGPYKLWHHTHVFKEFAGGTLMMDEVKFKLPMGFLGRLVAGSFVESDVGQIFDFRRQIIADQKF